MNEAILQHLKGNLKLSSQIITLE